MPRLTAAHIDKLNKELYYISEAISVCDGLLCSVQNAKNMLKQQCNSFLDEMSLSKEEWTVNLGEIDAIEKNVQSLVMRYSNVQKKIQKELDELGKGNGGNFVGRKSPIDI